MFSQEQSGPTGALLVGSVPLATVDDVFTAAGEHLGDCLMSIPDGEVGERDTWLVFQVKNFESNPAFRELPSDEVLIKEGPARQFVFADGKGPEDIEFGRLGYLDAALESYEIFKQRKADGVIPENVRFQVSLPTPMAPVFVFFGMGEVAAAVEPAYERALLAEAEAIAAAIPRQELAIQWDVCMEILFLMGLPAWWGPDAWGGCRERWAKCAATVPEGALLGYHLCYGDYDHKHFAEPQDTVLLAEMSRVLLDVSGRAVDWIHMPVPRERDDAEYFEALSDLDLGDTKLYLGLVHFSDGEEGARRRIAAAQHHTRGFGVATECGFGRRPVEQVKPLMEIHAAVAGPAETS
jgi:hypothetical protein